MSGGGSILVRDVAILDSLPDGCSFRVQVLIATSDLIICWEPLEISRWGGVVDVRVSKVTRYFPEY